MYSIIIPTFNNLEYLQLTLNSIHKNSKYNHEIIIHINDGTDGTLEFIKKEKIKYTYSTENLGLCTAVNLAAEKATTDYILYCHDDMYLCPNWDFYLNEEVKFLKTKKFYLSGTMIEQKSGHIQFDAGSSFKDFNEKRLISNIDEINYFDYQGSNWAPHLIHKETWNKIGGFSKEFNPGVGSDPDLNMKLWQYGVRIFKGLSNFKVYHFGSITLRKKKNLLSNKGSKIFLKKWRITPSFFIRHYLNGGIISNNKIISQKYDGPLNLPKKNLTYLIGLIKCKIKLFYLNIFYKSL